MSKVMISMPAEILKKFDKVAKARHKKRSELLKDLTLQFLENESSKVSSQNAFESLKEFKIDLEPNETAEKLIREIRDSR